MKNGANCVKIWRNIPEIRAEKQNHKAQKSWSGD